MASCREVDLSHSGGGQTTSAVVPHNLGSPRMFCHDTFFLRMDD